MSIHVISYSLKKPSDRSEVHFSTYCEIHNISPYITNSIGFIFAASFREVD